MSDDKVQRLRRKLVKPEEVPEIPVANNVDQVLFEAGYQHGLKSNTLRDFRLSFRLGFRKAKMEQQVEKMKNVVVLGTPPKRKQ